MGKDNFGFRHVELKRVCEMDNQAGFCSNLQPIKDWKTNLGVIRAKMVPETMRQDYLEGCRGREE